jgi:hypothetical protein
VPALLGCLSAYAVLATTFPAVADPISSVSQLSLRLNNPTSNDLGFASVPVILLSADSVTPNGVANPPTTVTAQPTNLSIGPQVIPFYPQTGSPNQFAASFPNDSNLYVPWNVTFANGADTLVLQTPSLVGVTPAPFANNVTVSGSGLNPTFTWSYPSSVNGVTVLIYDKSATTLTGQPDLVYSHSLPGSANSYTLPTNFGNGFGLTPGGHYDVVLKAEILRNVSVPLDLHNGNILTQSDSYFPFTPVTSGVPINLPTVNPTTGAYSYNMTVTAGTEYFIDPAVATGYAYQIGAGDPNFASVQLPSIQTNDFDLSYLVDGLWLTALVAPGGTFDFPSGGVTSFNVTGIDPSLMLNPNDATAFITGLTFTANGPFTGTQTPLTENVPEPSTIVILASGLAGILLSQRRRFLA